LKKSHSQLFFRHARIYYVQLTIPTKDAYLGSDHDVYFVFLSISNFINLFVCLFILLYFLQIYCL
ncbi:hypothetical protein T02_9911, partial [Trichinella nativa]